MDYPIAIVASNYHQKQFLRLAFGKRFVYLHVGEPFLGYRFNGAVIYEPGPSGSPKMDEANNEWLRLFKGLKLMPGAKTVTISDGWSPFYLV